MPEFYSRRLHRKYWGVRGLIRMLFNPPPKPPPLPDGAMELPAMVKQTYSATTPAGFPASFTMKLRLTWGLPLEPETRVRLSKDEVSEVLSAWEKEIVPKAMANRFLAFSMTWVPDYGVAVPRLLLWQRINTNPPEVHVDWGCNCIKFETNGITQGKNWHHNDVTIEVKSVDVDDPCEDPKSDFARLLPAQLKRLEALEAADVSRANAIVFRWLRQFGELSKDLKEAVAFREGQVTQLESRWKNREPLLLERHQTRAVVEHHQETEENPSH